jgi:hypothetical protein
VACTTTLNNDFGSAVTVTGAGFLLNDEMDDFSAAPGKANLYGLVQGATNAIAPGKRMLSAMTPTVVLDSARALFMVLGSPGGSRITTAVYQVISNVIDPKTGYDLQSQDSAPLLGRLIWGDTKFGDRSGPRFADLFSSGQQLSSQSYLAKVLTTRVNKVINVPSLADSYLTGINGGIVNMTLPNIDNWRRFAKSAAAGDSYIAEIYADPMIRNKVVLTFLDALILQYAGGPFPDPNFSIENFAIFASRDPVAIDATAARLIEEARKANKMPSIKPMIAYLEAASQLGLGVSAEWRIQMVRVGVEGIR